MRSTRSKLLIWLIVACVISAIAGVVSIAQSHPGTRASATYITKAEIDTMFKTFPRTGEQIKVVDVGRYNVGVSLQTRKAVKLGTPISTVTHSQITEVYYIVSGGGTLATAGTVADPKPMDPKSDVVAIAAGPTTTGIMTGGDRRKVSAGDVIIIPPGMPHGWSEIDDQVSYLMVRPDVDKILPAGYINPAIASK